MQVFDGYQHVPPGFGPSVVAIGNFDGVHCGHRAILAELRSQSAASGARAVVVTFEPHPLRLLRPADCPSLITPLPQKLALLATTGVDAAVVLPFTRELSEQSPRSFATDVLRDALQAVAVHEGDNFRFGYRAEAGLEQLRALGQELGFTVVAHSLLHRRGLPVSSSQVRACVAAGQLSQARSLLGRPFSLCSTPASGRGIGTRLLVPTINLAHYAGLKPAHGVYVTRLRIGTGPAARTFRAVTNAGNRPTFGEDSYAIESHLLDFAPLELTEETPLELTFLHRLRGEHQFPSPEALKRQIGRDVMQAQRYHALTQLLAPNLR